MKPSIMISVPRSVINVILDTHTHTHNEDLSPLSELCVCEDDDRNSYSEVEELRLLLVGSSLGQAGFAEVGVGHAGLD